MFALPEFLPKAYSRLRPNRSGTSLLQYKLSLLSPSACTPATWVNTFSPTIGTLGAMAMPLYPSTKRLMSFSLSSLILVRALKWSFRIT